MRNQLLPFLSLNYICEKPSFGKLKILISLYVYYKINENVWISNGNMCIILGRKHKRKEIKEETVYEKNNENHGW